MTIDNTIQFNTYVRVCLPLVVDLRGNDHLVLLVSLQHLFTIDAITKAIDFVFLLIAEATGRRVFARDVYRLRVRSGEPMMTLGSRTKAHTWNESTGIKKCVSTKANVTSVTGTFSKNKHTEQTYRWGVFARLPKAVTKILQLRPRKVEFQFEVTWRTRWRTLEVLLQHSHDGNEENHKKLESHVLPEN